MKILDRLIPKNITNQFEPNKVVLYVFAAIIVLTLVRSFIHIFATDGGAQSIAGFPLNTYPIEASSMIILIFSLWGVSQLIIGFVYLIVLVRYKSLIPAMYLLLLIEYTSRYLLGVYKPAYSTHLVPGGVLDYIMIPLCISMLILCVIPSKNLYRQTS
jgi:hypothetical protein